MRQALRKWINNCKRNVACRRARQCCQAKMSLEAYSHMILDMSKQGLSATETSLLKTWLTQSPSPICNRSHAKSTVQCLINVSFQDNTFYMWPAKQSSCLTCTLICHTCQEERWSWQRRSASWHGFWHIVQKTPQKTEKYVFSVYKCFKYFNSICEKFNLLSVYRTKSNRSSHVTTAYLGISENLLDQFNCCGYSLCASSFQLYIWCNICIYIFRCY